MSSGNQNQARNSEHKEGIAKDTNDRNDTLHTFEGDDTTTKSEKEEPEKCPNCDKMIDPYDKNTHPSCCNGHEVQ